MPNITLLLKIQKCKLWSGLIKPLEGINLEGVEYISPEMEQELGYREESAIHSWQKIQQELKETGVLEEKVLEWAAKVEEIFAREHYFADGINVRGVKKQKEYNIHHTGEGYCYISPILARHAYNEISTLVPASALREDREFLANIELLEKEYKPEYSKENTTDSILGPVFDKKSIDKMLSSNELAEAEPLKKNAAALAADLPFYKAAYERRQAFRKEVMKRSKARNFEYAIHEKHDVSDEWYDAFIPMVYERIKNDECICKLVNGQSAGRFWRGWTRNLRFDPQVTDSYGQKTLLPEGFRRWIDSYDASSIIKFALQGIDPKIRLLSRIGDRLQEHYNHKDNEGECFISEQEFFDVYPAAAKRLMAAFDGELLRFPPKT